MYKFLFHFVFHFEIQQHLIVISILWVHNHMKDLVWRSFISGQGFVLLMKSHLQSYPCPIVLNSFWNVGFLLGLAIILQIISGVFLAFHYTSDLYSAYFSVFFIIREIYYGWALRYFHSSGASFVFIFLFLHLGRALVYGSYFYNSNTWFSGIILVFLSMAIAFLGYVLPFGQMSFWGAVVITNLLSCFPLLPLARFQFTSSTPSQDSRNKFPNKGCQWDGRVERWMELPVERSIRDSKVYTTVFFSLSWTFAATDHHPAHTAAVRLTVLR